MRSGDNNKILDQDVLEPVNVLGKELAQLYNCSQKFAITNHINSFNDTEDSPSFGIKSAFINDVSKRSTSHVADEPIVLACAFGLDTEPLSAVHDNEERMAALFREMGTIPTWWIFQGLPRLSVHPYQWAPKSFLSMLGTQNINFSMRSVTNSVVSSDGLLTELSSVFFNKSYDCFKGIKGMEIRLGRLQISLSEKPLYCYVTYVFRGEYEQQTIRYESSQFDMMALDRDVKMGHTHRHDRGFLVRRLNSSLSVPKPEEPVVCQIVQSVNFGVYGSWNDNDPRKAVWDGVYQPSQHVRLV